MPTFRVADTNLYYETKGNGFPFVFSHGLGGTLERVREFVDDLPAVRTILFDNRGHGRSGSPADRTDLNFARMADDVAGLLDHLSIDKAVVGGVSMGAGVALAFGMRHPERVRALVLSRPAWQDQPNPANLEFAPVIADIVERHGIAAAGPIFEQTEYYRNLTFTSPGTADSLRTLLRESEETALLAIYRTIPASTPVDSMGRLLTIRAPTLVLGNRNDPIHPFEYAEAYARAIPGARLEEIVSRFDDEAGHVHQFRAAVARFLAELGVRQ